MNLTGKLLIINEERIFYPLDMQTEGDFELLQSGNLFLVISENSKDEWGLHIICKYGIGYVSKYNENYEVIV